MLALLWLGLVAGDRRVHMEEGYDAQVSGVDLTLCQERPHAPTNCSTAECRPHPPLLIRASIDLRNVFDVSEKEQHVSLETTLRLYWQVGRCQPPWPGPQDPPHAPAHGLHRRHGLLRHPQPQHGRQDLDAGRVH